MSRRGTYAVLFAGIVVAGSILTGGVASADAPTCHRWDGGGGYVYWTGCSQRGDLVHVTYRDQGPIDFCVDFNETREIGAWVENAVGGPVTSAQRTGNCL